MKKSIITLCFFCLLSITIPLAVGATSTQAAQTPTVSVNPTNTQLTAAYIGQTVQVNITVSNVHGLWGWEITDIRFNPSVLTLTNVLEGPFLQTGGQTFFLWTSNSSESFSKGDIPDIDDALAAYSGISGSGVLVTLIFQVIAEGNSPITLTTVSLYNSTEITPNIDYDTGYMGQINCTITNGVVAVNAINTATSVPIGTVPPYSPAPIASPNPSDASSSNDSSSTSGSGAGQGSHLTLFMVVVVVLLGAIIAALLILRRKR